MAGQSDLAHLGRLKEEEENALLETKRKIEQWHKFDEDYNSLQSRLSTLPDKVSHEIMVPFGKLAFMPGKLVHTNEIMVLLGDNWFAEQSAKQACNMIDRRKAYVKRMVGELKQQQYLLESRLGFVSDMKQTVEGKGDVVEIREEYDQDREAKWREERRAMMRETAASKTKSSKPSTQEEDATRSHSNKKTKEPTAEELMWARLDELERQEEELDELEMSEEEEEEEKEEEDQGAALQTMLGLNKATKPESEPSEKHVHWKEESRPTSSNLAVHVGNHDNEDDTEEEEEEEEDGEDTSSTTTIKFSHSDVPSENPPCDTTVEDLSPRSPADIYELYQSRNRGESGHPAAEGQPKSILKHSSSMPSEIPPAFQGQGGKNRPQPAPVSAFTGSIVEHNQPATVIQPPPTEQGQGLKRVSKFKAARQGRR